MKAQHTPGPWSVGEETDGRSRVHYVHAPRLYVYFSRTVGQTEETMRANARLIAAAPDLLAALEALDPYLDTIPGGIGEYIDNARAAIAKATGEA